MNNRLLDRQVRLLEHLTSGAAIFRTEAYAASAGGLGIHAGLLHLEARFSHEKRMAKIKWALPKTIGLLGSNRGSVVRDFVESCPPVSISRLENARQFHDFLSNRWTIQQPDPPYLLDVAACELAYATVVGSRSHSAKTRDAAAEQGIRRHPGVVLVRCRYDVRPILEESAHEPDIAERDTPLAVSMPRSAEQPLFSSLSLQLFESLELLDDFFDPKELSDLPELNGLLADLADRGLIEVRP
jgi:hypothetical protein